MGEQDVMPFLVSSVIASAFFLFLVQPLLAKQILPWFGGTASIWAVCMVFYQAALLAGYAYAHLLTRHLSPRRQAAVHVGVVSMSLLALPLRLSDPQATPGSPDWEIVRLLMASIGLPYFVLSSTSPLMQAWYARLEPQGKAYRLFGWSNLSCAVALLVFPFGLEPALELSALNTWWSRGYAAVAVLLSGAAVTVFLRSPEHVRRAETQGEAPPAGARASWLFFSALGSVLLVSITNHLCQVIAPVPFLWTVPLLLYLLTFVACFEREWYTRRWGIPLAGLAMVAMAWSVAYLPVSKMLVVGAPVFAVGCFLVCFYCHGELAARKPASAHLTEFYLMLALGGGLGSLLVAFGAPRVFKSYAEMPVAMTVCALAMLFTVYRKKVIIDIAATVCAILVAAPAYAIVMSQTGQVAEGRNFYGSLRVVDNAAQGRPVIRNILHGNISHGAQFVDPARRREAISYYGPMSAPGIWFRHTEGPRKVGLVGLGAGTLAAYGRAGDTLRFYEINSMVVDFARRHFTYLSDTPARVEVVIGDARLQLSREPAQGFDLLVVDAFSGDSIPVHLLTRQAFEVYLRHLKPGGVLALHLSNLYLDLQPVVRSVARSLKLESLPAHNAPDTKNGVHASHWAFVGKAEDVARLPVEGNALAISQKPPRAWTDDYSTLLAVLRR